jgi:hypothetical protein
MANTIDKIPEKMRWEIATKSLTGAYIAISKALKQAVGQKKFDEFNGPLWYQAGKGAKGFAKTSDYPPRAPKIWKRSHTSSLRRPRGRSLCSKPLRPPKTGAWAQRLNVLGTRGGRSKALTLIPAAPDIKAGVMELSRV